MDFNIEDVIKEVQTTNRFILKRLNTVDAKESSCQCACHINNPERELELEHLKQSIKKLEDRGQEKDKELKVLKHRLNEYKETLDTLPRSRIVQHPNIVGGITPEVKYQDQQPNIVGGITPEVKYQDQQPPVVYAYHASIEHDNSEISVKNCPTKKKDDRLTAGELDDHTRKASSDKSMIETLQDREQHTLVSSIGINRDTAQAENIYFEESNQSDLDDKESCNENEHILETRIADVKQDDNIHTSANITNCKSMSETVTHRKPIAKANFHKKSLSEKLGVKIVEQTEKRKINFMEWHLAANKEELQGRLSGLAALQGLLTIVCVDISCSMTQGNAWEQAKIFFKDLIETLRQSKDQFNIDEESVALVTFGHKTEVLKRLTNDFTSLQMSFDGISLGGPSPMYGGLLMSVAAIQSTLCGGGANVNGIPVATKIIIITDGNPTDTNLVAGPDELTPTEQEDTNSKILEVMQKMEGDFDVFCVPVGNANMEFVQLMVSVSDGKLITHKDGKKIGSRLRNTLVASGGNVFRSSVNGSDNEEIEEILEAAERRSSHRMSSFYEEIQTKNLPQIGSRVRRGPDWRWNDQDRNGPGTVVGHASNDQQIWVEWDKTNIPNIYRYHVGDGYDVLITDEPRFPENGRLAVGCTVKPGKDWQQNTRNVKVTDRGVVIKTLSEGRVQVRWSNKERGDYSVGFNGKIEVEFSPPAGTTQTNTYASMSHGAQENVPRFQAAAASPPQANRPNKNKNVVNKNKNKNVVNKNKNKNVVNKNKNANK